MSSVRTVTLTSYGDVIMRRVVKLPVSSSRSIRKPCSLTDSTCMRSRPIVFKKRNLILIKLFLKLENNCFVTNRARYGINNNEMIWLVSYERVTCRTRIQFWIHGRMYEAIIVIGFLSIICRRCRNVPIRIQ